MFNRTICAVLKIVLKRSSRTGYHAYQSDYKIQKQFIFEIIQDWMHVAKSGQDVEQLVQLTLDDVWVQLKGFEMVIKENQDDKSKLLSKEKGSRKRKHNSVEEQQIHKASKNISHIVQASKSAASALECLNTVLVIFGHALNANQHQAVLSNIHLFAKRIVEASMWENPLWSDDYNLMESVCKVLVTFNSSSHHLHKSSINFTLSLLDMIRSCEPQNRQLCQTFQNTLETIFHFPRTPVVIINPSSGLLQEPEITDRDTAENDSESSEDEQEEVVLSQQDENEITSTVDGGAENVLNLIDEEAKENGAVEIRDDSASNAALSISSGDEQDLEDANKSPAVMEVVDIGSGDDSVVELKTPELKSAKKRPLPAKKPKMSPEESAQKAKDQSSVDDIMLEFVDELV